MDQIVVHDAISERVEKACASLDVAGYNYMAARYEPDSVRYPNRVMVGSETYPPDTARNWALVKKLPCVIGDFTWTGWDYIGEAGVGVPAYAPGEGGFGAKFPCQLAYCGDHDLTGFRRPLSYYREIVFGLRKDPFIAVQDPKHYGQTLIKTPWVMSDAASAWDYPESVGKPLVIEVYAAGDEVELFVNEKSFGRKPAGPENAFRTLFETVYKPGRVRAVSFAGGEKLGESELVTPGETGLRIEQDYEGDELLYLTVSLTDANGIVTVAGDELLTAEAEGVEILAFGSGNPKPTGNYNEGKTETWLGRAQIILRKTEAASIRVKVCSASGKAAQFER